MELVNDLKLFYISFDWSRFEVHYLHFVGIHFAFEFQTLKLDEIGAFAKKNQVILLKGSREEFHTSDYHSKSHS